MQNKFKRLFLNGLSVIIAVVVCFALSACSEGQSVSAPTVSLSGSSSPAKGYTISTDDKGNTQVTNPSGEVIGDSSRGDNIILSDEGDLIITDKEGNSTIVNNNGTVIKPTVDTVASESKPSSTQQVSGEGNTIVLKGSGAEIKGDGVSILSKDIVITAAGTYVVSGSLDDGRIVVDAAGKAVKVILNGVSITNSNNCAFYVYAAKSVELSAYDGSVNILNDGITYVYTDRYSNASGKQPEATLCSKSDLILSGKGKLVVNSKSKNGVTSKLNLKAENIALSVSAAGHGITGDDGLELKNSKVKVTAGRDAVRTNNITDSSKGKVTLTGATMTLVSGEDAIQADTVLTVNSGTYNIKSGGGSANAPLATSSKKGLKGVTKLIINGGTITADCSDDAFHSNGDVEVKGGNHLLKSADDGIHADNDIFMSGGTTVISKSYEGLEATNVTLSGAKVQITATDDGINISGGDGSAGTGRPGMDSFGSSGGSLKISGGTVRVNAEGDGLDANGSIEISGGTVTVDGPTGGGNGVLDFDGLCTVTGGTLIAVGSADMAQAPSTSSTQNSLVYSLGGRYEGGNIVRIEGNDGSVICTYVTAKSFNWVCVSSPKIKSGVTYTLYVGGSCNGNLSDGCYTSGTYSGGTVVGSLTADSVVTSNGGIGGHGGMGGPGGPPPFH